jgi:membrane protease YdiL (CAAX protease family)
MIFQRLFDRIFHREKLSIKHVFALFSFVFVLWAVYRYFPEILPSWVEELILKPLVWLVPTFWLVKEIEREKLASLGFTRKNLTRALYWGIGLGVVFALEGFLTNILKYRGLNLISLDYTSLDFLRLLVISFVTALSEETVFRGYVFTRLWRIWKNEWLANIASAFLFTLIYLPVGIFVLGYRPMVMLIYLFFVFVYGFASAFAFARTENILASILLHVFWSWPIILFR